MTDKRIKMKKAYKIALVVIASFLIMFYGMSFLFVGIDTRNIIDNLNPVKLYEKISQARKFSYIKQIIDNEYIEKVDDDKLLENVYDGMLGSLGDKYSAYFTKEELEKYIYRREGAFSGIGLNVLTDYDDLAIEVTGFTEGSPAEKAGVKIGDLIVSADGTAFTDKDSMKAMMELISGEAGTKVSVGVYRKETDENLVFDITREKIFLNNTSKEMIGDIGYIRIKSFTKGVSKDFIEACAWIKEENVKGLIVDVRGNGGGSLDEVIKISDYLLEKVMIVYVEDRYGDRTEYFSDSAYYDIPLVVLVDASSASASELFAGSVQADGRGKIIGVTTFGKGIVQTDYYLSDGTGIKITTKKYYLPSGSSIHGVGITPDIAIAQSDDYKGYVPENIPKDKDLVLIKALDYLQQE